jgi:hypothetical protein
MLLVVLEVKRDVLIVRQLFLKFGVQIHQLDVESRRAIASILVITEMLIAVKTVKLALGCAGYLGKKRKKEESGVDNRA